MTITASQQYICLFLEGAWVSRDKWEIYYPKQLNCTAKKDKRENGSIATYLNQVDNYSIPTE